MIVRTSYQLVVATVVVCIVLGNSGVTQASCRRHRVVYYSQDPQNAGPASAAIPWTLLAGLGLDVLSRVATRDRTPPEPPAPRVMTTTRTPVDNDGIKSLRGKIAEIRTNLGMPAEQPPVAPPPGNSVVPPKPLDDEPAFFPEE